jgi:hypothetical protein
MKLEFFGRDADRNQLNLYDAGRSIEGLGRTLSILSHYYETGKIIHQAPSSKAELVIKPPAAGSFLVEVLAMVTAGVVLVPITFYLNYVMGQWLPGGTAADKAKLERLSTKLQMQDARMDGLEDAIRTRDRLADVQDELERVRRFVSEKQTDHDVMRSITSNSFADIYRPIGRSADYAAVYGDSPGAYAGVADLATVNAIKRDIADEELSEVRAVVNSFSRTSKVGVAFSRELGRGFRFHYGQMGPLGKEDDFSWSQYRQREIVMSGRFYRFFDDTIKRLEVVAVERIGGDTG